MPSLQLPMPCISAANAAPTKRVLEKVRQAREALRAGGPDAGIHGVALEIDGAARDEVVGNYDPFPADELLVRSFASERP